jgi:hypothetical protein
MRKAIFFIFLYLQLPDLSAGKCQKSIESIPFELVGSYVVIKVRINDSSPLNLILDSGIRNTIITELMEGDRISLNYSDVKELMGLGGGNHLGALTSNFNSLKIGKLILQPKTVYVLQDDIFNLSKHSGSKINGLIGVDFFEDYIVEIDYSARRIRFFENKKVFQCPKGYGVIPMNIEGQKMFIQLSVLESDSTHRNVKMLIDTGAELNAWFQTFKKGSVHIPEKGIRGTIGQGLNGEIVGKFGRLSQIFFGEFCLTEPIVSFPDSVCIADIVKNSDRDGTIGSQLLSRFNLFIDYNNKQFYLKPNGNFKNRFKYNVAGIEISQIIPFIPQTEVWLVWENSPAYNAGIRVGDQIIEINGQKAFQYNINEIKYIFETPSSKPLKLVVGRDGKEISLSIDMKSQI